MEIEGDESEINDVERKLGMGLTVEHSTYPQLALKDGSPKGDRIEARSTS